jgi:FAD/FMN-containing dehydrogenase
MGSTTHLAHVTRRSGTWGLHPVSPGGGPAYERQIMEPDFRFPAAAVRLAAQCRHYAMCKIDYLGTGLCPAAAARPWVSYFPQGRMDLCVALDRGLVPFTEGARDIIAACDLCGRCDRQCHFVTGMRPTTVMTALADRLAIHRAAGHPVATVAEDEPLRELRRIVGPEWATNDPALRIAYAHDPFPLAGVRMPAYVVLPGSREEVAAVVRTARRLGLPCVARGNGASVLGLVFTDGVVIDLYRLKTIEIDAANWTAAVGPGVTAFELQSAAAACGLRANTAEPAATVCGNIVCTGIFSTWANVYGVGADGIVDMDFIDPEGREWRLGDPGGPNRWGFDREAATAPGICLEARVRLHPTTPDEEGLLVPFESLAEAVAFATDLSRRRIGLAVGVLGGYYLSNFLAPSAELAARIEGILPNLLDIAYAVAVVGDAHARAAIGRMAPCVIDAGFLRTLALGAPRLDDRRWRELVAGHEWDGPVYEALFTEEMRPVIEAVLDPSPETLAAAVPPDLKPFYEEIYRRPRMTDPVWLTMFRILSARLGRDRHMFAFLLYVPPDDIDTLRRILALFAGTADACGLVHAYGFLTPLDLGRRAILEYDYYVDQTDPAEAGRIAAALERLEPALAAIEDATPGVCRLNHVLGRGFARKEGYLYT